MICPGTIGGGACGTGQTVREFWRFAMRNDDEQAREYDRMRGAYLGLVASLEMNLTFLLAKWLEVGRHREEFHDWFMEAPIPFRSKIRLCEALTKSGWLTDQFGNLADQMREFYDFRNMLAHSFHQLGSFTTSRGKRVSEEEVSFEVLEGKLERLARLDNLILNLLANEIEGPPSRCSLTILPIGLTDFFSPAIGE